MQENSGSGFQPVRSRPEIKRSVQEFDVVGMITTNMPNGPVSIRGVNGPIAYWTDKGVNYPKDRNEDGVFVNSGLNAFAVIDGMGGQNGGDTASRILAKEIQHAFRKGTSMNDMQAAASQKMMKDPRSVGGGACYLATQIDGGELKIWQAGDVRLIVIRGERVVFETQDESASYDKSIVTNVVTSYGVGRTTVYRRALELGDRVIIGSDGLWDNLDSKKVATLAAGTSNVGVDLATEVLRQEALESMENFMRGVRGKPDNISIVMFDYEQK